MPLNPHESDKLAVYDFGAGLANLFVEGPIIVAETLKKAKTE